MSPRVVIEFPIEAPPSVRLVCSTLGEEERLVDWITGKAELLELVRRALELAEEARAA
jgi:hypothetical protein